MTDTVGPLPDGSGFFVAEVDTAGQRPDVPLRSSSDLLETAWGIIANAGGGNWTKESLDWQQAAIRWRDEYHEALRQGLTAGGPES